MDKKFISGSSSGYGPPPPVLLPKTKFAQTSLPDLRQADPSETSHACGDPPQEPPPNTGGSTGSQGLLTAISNSAHLVRCTGLENINSEKEEGELDSTFYDSLNSESSNKGWDEHNEEDCEKTAELGREKSMGDLEQDDFQLEINASSTVFPDLEQKGLVEMLNIASRDLDSSKNNTHDYKLHECHGQTDLGIVKACPSDGLVLLETDLDADLDLEIVMPRKQNYFESPIPVVKAVPNEIDSAESNPEPGGSAFNRKFSQMQSWVNKGNYWTSDEESCPQRPDEVFIYPPEQLSPISSLSSGALLNVDSDILISSDIVEIEHSQNQDLSESDLYACGAPLEFSVSSEGNDDVVENITTTTTPSKVLSFLPKIKQLVNDWTPTIGIGKNPTSEETEAYSNESSCNDQNRITTFKMVEELIKNSEVLEKSLAIVNEQTTLSKFDIQKLKEYGEALKHIEDAIPMAMQNLGPSPDDGYTPAEMLWLNKLYSSKFRTIKPDSYELTGEFDEQNEMENKFVPVSALAEGDEDEAIDPLLQLAIHESLNESTLKEELELNSTDHKDAAKDDKDQIYDDKYLGRSDIFHPLLSSHERKMLGVPDSPKPGTSQSQLAKVVVHQAAVHDNPKGSSGISNASDKEYFTANSSDDSYDNTPIPRSEFLHMGYNKDNNSLRNGIDELCRNSFLESCRIDESVQHSNTDLKSNFQKADPSSDESSIVAANFCVKRRSNTSTNHGSIRRTCRRFNSSSDIHQIGTIEESDADADIGNLDKHDSKKEVRHNCEQHSESEQDIFKTLVRFNAKTATVQFLDPPTGEESQSEEKPNKSAEFQHLLEVLPFYESKKVLKKEMKKDIANFKKQSQLATNHLKARLSHEDYNMKQFFTSQINESKQDVKKHVRDAKLSYIQKQETLQEDLLKGRFRKILEKYKANSTSVELKYKSKTLQLQVELETKMKNLKLKQERKEKQLKESMQKELRDLEHQVRMKKLHVYSVKEELDISSLQDLMSDVSLNSDV